jgi:hypothetical protein
MSSVLRGSKVIEPTPIWLRTKRNIVIALRVCAVLVGLAIIRHRWLKLIRRHPELWR